MQEFEQVPIENAVSLCLRLVVLRKINFNSTGSDLE